jgi:heterodisulfide reductase subunit B
MEKLGIELVDVPELGCCGYPLRNISFRAHILASARNLALTEKENLDLLTVCNCCYGTLKYVDQLMGDDAAIRKEVNTTLEKEGLRYEGDIKPKHILQVLYDDVGIETIRDMIVKPFDGLRIATHYGCRIGSPLWGINNELSLDLTENKLRGAKESGADYLCVACSYCQIQFDRVQRILLIERGPDLKLPSVLYPQLLGLALGIDGETLGLQRNKVSITDIEFFLYHRAAR